MWKKSLFSIGIVSLVVLVGFAVGLFAAIIYNQVQAEDHWIEVPVYVCIEQVVPGQADSPFLWKNSCINGGRLWILLSEDTCKAFVYEGTDGKRHPNDWNQLVNSLKNIEQEELKKPQKQSFADNVAKSLMQDDKTKKK